MKNKKILLAEDEEFLSRALSDNLKEDYDITPVFNGEGIIDILKQDKFDLLLLDIMMPGENGFSILEKIKSDEETKDIKIIIISNLGQETDIEKAKKLGADDYLVKANNSLKDIAKKIEEHIK
jgi:PleD family two-component response regulator